MNISSQKMQGFTLMELMITVAIIGILAAITIPSYTEYVKKTKRSDAKIELMRLAQMQESYFVQNMSYAKDLTTGTGGLGLGTSVQSEQGLYDISIAPTPANCTGTNATPCTGYVLSALPSSGSQQAKDSSCIKFSISNTGLKGAFTGTITSPVAASTAQMQTCWK